MARQKLIHIHSVAKNTSNDGPKLPTADQIEYGEIAVNYLKDNETISIKNNGDEIKSLSLNAPFFFNTNGNGGIESSFSRGGATGKNSFSCAFPHTVMVQYKANRESAYIEGDKTDVLRAGMGYYKTDSGTFSKVYIIKSVSYASEVGRTDLTLEEVPSLEDTKLISGTALDYETKKAYFYDYVTASGANSHAEGGETIASGDYSHAEGYQTAASGANSHAEGNGTSAENASSHAEGGETIASGKYSHAEGYQTTASGANSHAEGNGTAASGKYSHAEGCRTTASGTYSHAEGYQTTASGTFSHAEGYQTTASANSHAEGSVCMTLGGDNNHVEGWYSLTGINASSAHAEGRSLANSTYAHSEGMYTVAGNGTTDGWAHSEGGYTYAHGIGSHCEGYGNVTLCLKGKVVDVEKKTFELYLDETSSYFHWYDSDNGNNGLKDIWPYIPDAVKPLLFRCGERYFYTDWGTLATDYMSGTVENATLGVATYSINDPVYNAETKTLTFTEDFTYSNGVSMWGRLFDYFTKDDEFYVGWVLNSIVSGYGSHKEGKIGVCSGNYSHCQGAYNLCASSHAFVGGKYCVNQAFQSFVHGIGLINKDTNVNSMTIGQYNVALDNGLFVIGLGSDSNNRANALVVTSGAQYQTINAWTTSSDMRLKNVVNDTIAVDVNKVAEMPVFTYTRKDVENSQTMIGSSAQYWQEALPEAVKEDESGYLSLDYNGVLLSSVKSLAMAIESYKTEIEDLKKEIEELKSK